MKKVFLLIFLFIPLIVFSAIKVPSFSFIGQEISKFEIKSSFSTVDIDFKGNTKFDTYINTATLEFQKVEKTEYKGKDPGFMYSGEFGTNLSAVFVGEKAYKNLILKKYLNKKYIEVLSNYKEYKKKFKKEEYKTEAKFIYALALLETGGFDEATTILKEIAISNNSFSDYAIDKLMSFYFKSGKYDELLSFSNSLEVLTPHPLYLTLYTYLKRNDYSNILELLKKYDSYKDKHSFLYDFEIIANYYSGNFEKVASFLDYANKTTNFFIIDSLLILNKKNQANDLIQKLEKSQMKIYFQTKLSILDDEIEMATFYLNQIEEENDKLNLFFFYISKSFPYLNINFMNSFELTPINMDYVNFYKGIFYLQKRKYQQAAYSLEKVSFKKELITPSYFYKAMSYIYFNKNKAEYYFIKFISKSNDTDKVTISRFMLAQLKYLNNKYNDALVVLSGCNQIYCKELKAEIYIKQKKYKTALKTLKSIHTDRAKYLTAVCYFNQKKLNKTKKILLSIKKKNKETELLLMNTYYKTGNINKANQIFNKYKNDDEFINAAVKHLFLSANYNQVLNILDSLDNLNDELLLIKAKALYSIKKYKESEEIFKQFIDKKIYLYDSIYGLISINQATNNKSNFVKESLKLVDKYDFDKKDFLIIQLAKLALEKNEINTGIKLINKFFEKYKKSPYTTDAYIVKAGLFMKLKRYDECVADMNSVLKKYKNNEDALFQKAECLEYVNKEKALDTYLLLSNKSSRFRSVSYIKIIELSDDKEQLLKSANYFKNVDTIKYLEASEKFLSKINPDEILNYDDMVYNLLDSNNEKFVPAGLYYTGLIHFKTKNYKQAARYALKEYYLFKKSKYSLPALQLAKESYINLKDEKSAKKIEELIKKIKK